MKDKDKNAILRQFENMRRKCVNALVGKRMKLIITKVRRGKDKRNKNRKEVNKYKVIQYQLTKDLTLNKKN